MTKATTILRPNRAGLRRFRYIDANAATLLEDLRLRLEERFPGRWSEITRAIPPGERSIERKARLEEQYKAGRSPTPDWGWEIARSFARAAHVLVEHIDAYTNEGYLGTATQWESVRRMVAMIGHLPGPPSSASADLVLFAKPGASGEVDKGFAVKHSPPAGGPPITFETLADVEIDAALNALRPSGWDRSPAKLGGTWLKLDGKVKDLVVGEPLVLEDERSGKLSAHVIVGVIEGEALTQVRVTPGLPSSQFRRGSTVVHVKPKDRLLPIGPVEEGAIIDRILRLARSPAGLLPGEIVTVSDGKKRVYRRVKEIHGQRLILDRPIGELAVGQATVSRAVMLGVSKQKGVRAGKFQGAQVIIHAVMVPGDWSRLEGDVVAGPRTAKGKNLFAEYAVMSADYRPVDPKVGNTDNNDDDNRGYTILRLVQRKQNPGEADYALHNPQSILVPPTGAGTWEADTALIAADKVGQLPEVMTVSQPKSTSGGDMAVMVAGSQASWARLDAVTVDTDNKRAALRPGGGWQGRGGGAFFRATSTLYGHFKERLRIHGWQENATPLAGKAVPLDVAPAALRQPGRRIILSRADDPGFFMSTVAVGLGGGDGRTLMLRDALPPGLTSGNLVILGNVVVAGHGERKTEKVLGSGDATRSGQTFILEESGVSFVADPTRPQGVSADIDVIVDGRIWTQAGSFRGLGPADPVYITRMTEEGHLGVEFGDGQRGRRLPTGKNNVRIRYRIGVGLAGNVRAGSLEKIARPHPLVASVRQPISAAGGNDMESVDSLRKTAPATLFAVERAVSLRDFESLAAGYSSVWQARAFTRPGASRAPRVEVVVVPADGLPLGSFLETIAAYLRAHALPGVEVEVTEYKKSPIDLQVDAEIDTTACAADDVVRALRAALLDALSLRRRSLGQPLYLSEIYQVVETVTGINSSVAVLGGDPGLRRLDAPSGKHVLFLDLASSNLTLRSQAYSL
jgi:hypothetical protein